MKWNVQHMRGICISCTKQPLLEYPLCARECIASRYPQTPSSSGLSRKWSYQKKGLERLPIKLCLPTTTFPEDLLHLSFLFILQIVVKLLLRAVIDVALVDLRR